MIRVFVILILTVAVGAFYYFVSLLAIPQVVPQVIPQKTKTSSSEKAPKFVSLTGKPLDLKKISFQSAETCKACHTDIYDEWKQSWMAKSSQNKMFQLSFQQWKAFAQRSSKFDENSCLSCHAPIGYITEDYQLQNSISREGVSCDVCHRVADVQEHDFFYSLVLDPGDTKYGPYSDAIENPFHKAKQGRAVSKSELCATCHLDSLPTSTDLRVPLEWTFQEWKESSYASEKRCQDCHMPTLKGKSADFPNAPVRKRFSHKFEGGHSDSSLLDKAAEVRVVSWSGTELLVEVHNKNVGHHFPTKGAHPTELILWVKARDDINDIVFQDRRSYKLHYLNAQGKIAGATEVVKSLRDETLKPKEKRQETFSTLSVPEKIVKWEVQLWYFLVPPQLEKFLGEENYQKHYRPVLIDKVDEVVGD